MNPEADNSIQDNIRHDSDLDYRVATNVDKRTMDGLRALADKEHDGNFSATVRACIVNALRTRYLLAE